MTGVEEPTERLAAILAADVVGYSRLMREDERRTVTTLDEYRDVFRRGITEHGGRVVDMAGDSVLAVFDSVSAAVNTATCIQTELARRNADRPANEKMEFRMGINLGDILEKSDGTVYGDGVNVAARLESLALPGGINVSGSVFNSVRSKMSAAFEFLGEQELKNIANPVPVYRLLPDTGQAGEVPVDTGSGADSAPHHPPTVAVVPFTVISGDDEVESLAAGLRQDILSGLTRQSAIAVQSSGDDARADFRLEGTVRAAGDRLRLSFLLVDTAADRQVWSERYDRNLEDIFDLEDEISFTVASTLRIRIKARTFEKLRDSANADLSTGDLLSKAAGFFVTSYRHNKAAAETLDLAIEREPDNAMANAMMVFCRYRQHELTPLGIAETEREEMATRIAAALSSDPGSYFAHLIAAIVHQDLFGDFATARVHAETSLEINPGFSPAAGTLGVLEIHCGDPGRGFERLHNALVAAPEDPHRYRHYRELAVAHYLVGESDESLDVIERLVRQAPELARNRLTAVGLAAAAGRVTQASTALEELRAGYPALTQSTARPQQFNDRAAAARFRDALAEAGLPE